MSYNLETQWDRWIIYQLGTVLAKLRLLPDKTLSEWTWKVLR